MAELQKVIERENLLTQDQSECNQFNHELVSVKPQQSHLANSRNQLENDQGNMGSISLANLDSHRTYQGLKFIKKKCSDSESIASFLTTISTSRDIFSTPGNLGSEFLIDTDELKHILLQNGYENIDLINEFVNVA